MDISEYIFRFCKDSMNLWISRKNILKSNMAGAGGAGAEADTGSGAGAGLGFGAGAGLRLRVGWAGA